MREIKFRFIFKDGSFFAKRYMTLGELLDSNFALEQMKESVNSDSNIFDIEDYPDYEVFKDEYTGLKDKNKDDIYEGDIIKITTESNSWISKVGNHGVWHEIIVNDSDLDIDFVSINYAYDALDCEIEVIGNIYENPELLGNK